MDSYDKLDIKNWTPGFVLENRAKCLDVLRKYVSTATELLQEKKYRSAVGCMKDIALGLIKMEDEKLGDFGKQYISLGLMMPATAICGILEVDAPESSRKEAALQYAMELAAEDPNHELAACYPLAKEEVLHYIVDLRSNATPDQIMRKNNLPAELFDCLRSIDRFLAEVATSYASFSPSYASSDSSYSTHVSPPTQPFTPEESSSVPPRPTGRAVVVLVLVVIASFLFFRARPSDKPEPTTSPISAQNAKFSPEDTLESLPESTLKLDPSIGFVFPDSDTRVLEQQEIQALTDDDLSYAINELYARHGYIFRASEIQEYYEQFSWYTPEVPADNFSVADRFNQIEKQNLNMLGQERDRQPDYENESGAWAYATLASSGDNSVEGLVLRELTENGGWSKYFDGTNSDVWLKEYPTSSSRVRQTAKITTGREFELFISDNANAYLSRTGAINQNMTAYDMAVAEYSQSIFDRMHSELDWLGAGTVLDSTVQTINGNSWYVYSGSNSGNGTQDRFYIFFFMDAAQEIAAEVSFEYLLYSGASSADANLFNEWYLNLSDSLLIH